jgi:hypothetical protein
MPAVRKVSPLCLEPFGGQNLASTLTLRPVSFLSITSWLVNFGVFSFNQQKYYPVKPDFHEKFHEIP